MRSPSARSIVSILWAVLLLARVDAKATHRRSASTVGNSSSSSHGLEAFPLEETEWTRLQATYAAQLACRVSHNEVLDLVIYGDSITESLRGTGMGKPYAKVKDIPAVWDKHFSSWQALPLGIAGDRTVNLLWRIREGGESPPELAVKAAVILIGTNDFYNHYENLWEAAPMSEVATIVTEISAGIVAIVGALRMQLPTTHIVLLGILPRGNLLTGGPSADENDYMLPSMFDPHIEQINERLESFAKPMRSVTYLDCGAVFIKHTSKGPQIDPELMADALHPTAEGMDKLLGCLKPHLGLPARHHSHQQSLDTT